VVENYTCKERERERERERSIEEEEEEKKVDALANFDAEESLRRCDSWT
jgi:hypothetical protein